MKCPNCNGDMHGDGYSTVLECENREPTEESEFAAPDEGPFYCNFEESKMPNTTVTITYANGETREFIASDDLEQMINEGEMFSVTTMHSDISRDEEMQVSKMYVGNPVAALGQMMMMKRNAEQLDSDPNQAIIIDILTVCIKMMGDEITSHQSGMTPVESTKPDLKLVDGDREGREDCPVISRHCDYFAYQCDDNGEVAISHCGHPENSSDYEGNCTSILCPLCTEGGG